MAYAQNPEGVPHWDLADRLRKALREAHVTRSEMAKHLGVNRNTITNYVNGNTRPPWAAVRVWALRCGVPYDWLRTGQTTPDGGTPNAAKDESAWTIRPLQLVA